PERLEELLRVAPGSDPAEWDRIRRNLIERAQAEGLVDVAFERHDSPLGTILLGATPQGLVRVGLPAEGEDAVLEELARRASPRVLSAPRDTLTDARRQLQEYFDRERRALDLPLDWRPTNGFR